MRRLWGKEGRIQDDKDDIILTETESQDSEKQQMINALFSGISAGKVHDNTTNYNEHVHENT